MYSISHFSHCLAYDVRPLFLIYYSGYMSRDGHSVYAIVHIRKADAEPASDLP